MTNVTLTNLDFPFVLSFVCAWYSVIELGVTSACIASRSLLYMYVQHQHVKETRTNENSNLTDVLTYSTDLTAVKLQKQSLFKSIKLKLFQEYLFTYGLECGDRMQTHLEQDKIKIIKCVL